MPNPRLFLQRRKAVQSTSKLTRTMELVATAKLQRAQNAAVAARPYAEGLSRLLDQVSGDPAAAEVSHPLMVKRPVKQALVVLCCSDRGLCGSFNAALIRLAMARVDAQRSQGAQASILCLGKKAVSALRYLGYPVDGQRQGIMHAPRFDQAREIAVTLMERFQRHDLDQVEVVYSRLVSKARQIPDSLVLLPSGGASLTAASKPGERHLLWLYEPPPERILEQLIPLSVRTTLFSTLLQTAAGEHAARRLAMKNATDNARDLIVQLTRQYNRARQYKITQEIAEIVGAVEAMK